MQDTLVVGIGNALQRDDGFGVRVIERLQLLELPLGVEAISGGTTAISLLDIIANRQKVIIVDAVHGGGEAGTIYRLAPEEVEAEPGSRASGHQIGLLETLAIAKQLGCNPRSVVIVGVEPKSTGWGEDLSPEVEAVLPDVVRLVLEEARRSTLSGKGG